MKRFALVTIILLLAGLQAMAQGTTTTTSGTAVKPAASSTTTKPAANSATKPAPNAAPRHVIYLEGNGTIERTDRDGNVVADSKSRWASPSFEPPREERERAEREAREARMEAAAHSVGTQGGVWCRGPERRPCEEWNVREMSRRMDEKRSEHASLADIRSLRLESSDGRLACEQASGERCNWEQIRSLNDHVAAELRCEIYFDPSPSNQRLTNTTQNHASTTRTGFSTARGNSSRTSGNTSTTVGSGSSVTTTATSSNPVSTTTTTAKTQNHSLNAQNHPPAAGEHAAMQHHPVPPHRLPPQGKQN